MSPAVTGCWLMRCFCWTTRQPTRSSWIPHCQPRPRLRQARLAGRVTFLTARVEDLDLRSSDIVVSVHACGGLSDVVLDRAASARARVAVLPCCHDLDVNDDGGLAGWIDRPLAVDVVRALRLKQQGYRTWTQSISGEITPKNRLLIGEPQVL